MPQPPPPYFAAPPKACCTTCKRSALGYAKIGEYYYADPCGHRQALTKRQKPKKRPAKREHPKQQEQFPLALASQPKKTNVYRRRQEQSAALPHEPLSTPLYVEWENVKVPSTANERLHWAVKSRRTAFHRTGIYQRLREAHGVKTTPALPLAVILTRVAPRPIRDSHDNLAMAFKAITDGVADFLGIEDDAKGVAWERRQAKGTRPRQTAVIVELVPSG